jgi:hypothetical protein
LVLFNSLSSHLKRSEFRPLQYRISPLKRGEKVAIKFKAACLLQDQRGGRGYTLMAKIIQTAPEETERKSMNSPLFKRI